MQCYGQDCISCRRTYFSKRNSQTSRAQSALNPFYAWCSMLLTGLHHSPVVNFPLQLPWNSSLLHLHLPPLLPFLTCTRVRGNHHHHQVLLWCLVFVWKIVRSYCNVFTFKINNFWSWSDSISIFRTSRRFTRRKIFNRIMGIILIRFPYYFMKYWNMVTVAYLYIMIIIS